jgi:hypothetical protein
MKLVFSGLMSSVTYSDQEITIKAFDRVDQLRQEFRNFAPGSESFYSTVLFPSVDPNFVGRPVRYVYGVVNGFVPVNVDYLLDSPTTSDNRTWAVCIEDNSLSEAEFSVANSPASTTTRTYFTSVNGLDVGDNLKLAGPYYVKVLTVNRVSNYVEHAAIAAPMSPTQLAKRPMVAALTIVQDGVKYEALYDRDYTMTLSNGVIGFQFSTSLESNLSMPRTLSPNDVVFCRVYGKQNNVTIGGPLFGSNDTQAGCLTNPVIIAYDLLKSGLGIPESEINTASFQALQPLVTSAVGFSIPENSTDQFPTFQDLFANLLESELFKIYLDGDSKWKITQLGPLGAATKSTDDTEIIRSSLRYEFRYDDVLSDIIVEYGYREIADDIRTIRSGVSSVIAESETALFLHKVKKQRTFHSLHFRPADAATLAARLSFALGDRQGIAQIQVKNRFFDTLLSDTISVSRTRMPGFEFSDETERSRSFGVTEVNRSLNQVDLILDDQKGIEDNSADW